MSKKLKDHLLGSWITYVAVLVAIVLLWGMVYETMAKPKANEQVVITMYSSDIDLKAINEKLHTEKSAFTSQALKSVYITVRDKDDPMLNQFIMADIEISDIIIFTEDMLLSEGEEIPAVVPSGLFRFLGTDNNPEHLEKIIGERADTLEYFYDKDINGVSRPIGIYLTDSSEDKNLFESHYNGEERAVAFISQNSVNIGNMFSDAAGTYTAAVDALLYLLEKK